MTSSQKTLYSDTEIVSLDQAISDFVNVTHRGLDCKSADMLTAVLDHLENIPCSNLNEKQKEYLDSLISIATLRLELAREFERAINMATKEDFQLEGISVIKTEEERTGIAGLDSESLGCWATDTIFAKANPRGKDTDYLYVNDRQPNPKESVMIALASIAELLAKFGQYSDNDEKPRISTIAKAIELKGMYGQNYENLRKLLKDSITTKHDFSKPK